MKTGSNLSCADSVTLNVARNGDGDDKIMTCYSLINKKTVIHGKSQHHIGLKQCCIGLHHDTPCHELFSLQYISMLRCDSKACPQSELKISTLNFICVVSFPLWVSMHMCMTVFRSFTLSFIILYPPSSQHDTCHPSWLLVTPCCSMEVDLWYETRHWHTINTHGLFIYHLFSRVCFIYAHIFIISPLCIPRRRKVIYYWVLQPWGATEDVSLWIIS